MIRSTRTSASTSKRHSWRGVAIAAAALALLVLGLRLGPEMRRPRAEGDATSRASGAGSEGTRWRRGAISSSDVPIDRVDCTLDHLIGELRAASRLGSPAYTAYLFDLVTSLARRLPIERVLAMFETERDPTVLEALGLVLCEYHAETENAGVLARMLGRARRDADPAIRAAVVRSLRATAEPAGLALRHAGTSGVPTYDALVRDPSPEVRRAVIENLAQEIEASSGHDPETAREALRVATASNDPRARADILEHVSLEHASAEDFEAAGRLLHSDEPSVAAAAARSLGTVAAEHAADAVDELVRLYRDPIPRVLRSAILEAIVHIRFADAIGVLESLAPLDPALGGEIAAWIAAIRSGYQIFEEIAREKARIERSA